MTEKKVNTRIIQKSPSKVTMAQIKDFYAKLSSFSPLHPLPSGEFKLFDSVNVTEAANSGV